MKVDSGADRSDLDDFDRALLRIVQRDNRLTHDRLADAVGLSPSAVRRRLARLRSQRIIAGDVALVDPARTGVTVITSIRMAEESRSTYEGFKSQMLNAPEVSQCYTVSGEVDFIVVAHLRDLPSYERWIDQYILSNDSVQRSDTNIVYSRVKYTTEIAI